ncbi:mitochondrial peripheral inner membrane protein [Gnomoniopsis smithogilvyi]|uniref:Mitochondrial peripheral inner membrane protein n=1 Tax=Gnomoniopsis smithogilvyi TaxID=1191159 RepID=A0A9W9CW28_9PEZI|nr:mitochondrial peripheral inner membrane protein [Gnomoniopsis smithogilvyi]
MGNPGLLRLTATPSPLPTNDAAVAAAWRHGLWSVEVKQPQLQIARHYTPLPGQAAAAGQLQFYAWGKEEEEEGRRKVVFLAGGTGVAPALQAGEYALGREGVNVEILWANRSGVDCAGCQRLPAERSGWFSSGVGPVDERHLEEEPSAVVRQIRELQAGYEEKGRKLEVKCAVDEEGSIVKARNIMDAVGEFGPLQGLSSPSCHFHSQQQLKHSTEESDVSNSGDNGDERNNAAPTCTCKGEGVKGKNLFIVSGPDGFVSAYVGPKVWADGGERQGPVGGVVSALMQGNPEIWKDWLILKQ